jgi:hypothetical protein
MGSSAYCWKYNYLESAGIQEFASLRLVVRGWRAKSSRGSEAALNLLLIEQRDALDTGGFRIDAIKA